MKRFIQYVRRAIKSAPLALACLAMVCFLNAQTTPPVNASDFSGFTAYMTTPIAATGSASFTVTPGFFSGSRGETPVPVLTNNGYVTFDTGSTAETLQVTSVTCSNGAPSQCTGTATFANTHPGNRTLISTATGGVQEAASWLLARGSGLPGFVVVGPVFGSSNTPFSLVTGNIMVEDLRGLSPLFWAPRPTTLSLIPAGSAVTLTGVNGGALTSTGTYYVSYEYVDALGGISLPATDSSQITLSGSQQTVTTSAVAATTGAVGFIPLITASAGSAGTEIEVPVTSSVCTLATALVSTGKPVCAIGATATIAANPSSTAKEVAESTAHTIIQLQAFSALPPAFQTQFGPFVATGTLNSSNADGAQMYVPAGYFNYLGKTWDVCVKGATATQVASSTLVVKLQVANQYGQSPVTLSTISFPTQTQAAAGTFGGCFRITTNVTGTSGKFWSVTPLPWYNVANAAATTIVNGVDVTTAASSAIDLTQGIYLSVNLASGTANNITAPIINALSIVPVNGN
jgi:hypothetical protein